MPEQVSSPGTRNCSIWICTNETEQDCFSRRVFGDPPGAQKMGVHEGEACFLLNVDSHELHGSFITVSDAGFALDNDAWANQGGVARFPVQVRVKPISAITSQEHALPTLRRMGVSFRQMKSGKFAPNNGGIFPPEITVQLLDLFGADHSVEQC